MGLGDWHWLSPAHTRTNEHAHPQHTTHACTQALAQLSPAEAAGDWHFCRGVLDCESGEFLTYDQVNMSE